MLLITERMRGLSWLFQRGIDAGILHPLGETPGVSGETQNIYISVQEITGCSCHPVQQKVPLRSVQVFTGKVMLKVLGICRFRV